MEDRFGIEIPACPSNEQYTCKHFRSGTSAYCSSLYWTEGKMDCVRLDVKRFACVKYPNDP